METNAPADNTGRWSRLLAVSCLLAAALQPQYAEAEETLQQPPRDSRTTQYGEGGRESSRPGTISEDRFEALLTEGERKKPAAAGQKPETSSSKSKGAAYDFWFFDADVQLFNDDDGDGFYHGIDVLFDVDTLYDAADVYAALYLSYEGGPWNEYAVTDTFTVFGATSDDEYVVVTELMTGYPRGNYDLLIELYDAWDGTFLAEFGPADHPDFVYLPLEDFNRDDPPRRGHHGHGGGALDPWTGLLLAMSALAAWLVRRRQEEYARGRPYFLRRTRR